jgi:hypothetical protein
MTHQAVHDRVASGESVRPRILAGHDPAGVIGQIVIKGRPAAVGGIRENLLNHFLLSAALIASAPSLPFI